MPRNDFLPFFRLFLNVELRVGVPWVNHTGWCFEFGKISSIDLSVMMLLVFGVVVSVSLCCWITGVTDVSIGRSTQLALDRQYSH